MTGTVFRTGNPLSVTLSSTAGYRLPSFTERQYAVRGGLAGKRFPWGDTIQHAQANYWSTNTYSYDISPTRGHHPSFNDGVEPYTAPVGSFPENGYGLCDMIGNVQEFCFDWATYYSIFYGKVNGGGWNTDSHICKIIVMVQWTATASAANVGFRIVRTAPQ